MGGARTEVVSLQNVSRYEHHRYLGWVVRIRREGRTLVRYFADLEHGGRSKALAKAIGFRDRSLERLPPLLMVMRRYIHNKTGVVGVRVRAERKAQRLYRF